MKMRIIIITTIMLIAVSFAIPETSQGQRRGWSGRGRGPMPSDTLPVPREGQEKRILDVLEDMAVNQTGMLNVSMDDGRLLRLLTETMDAKHVVEIGTSNGYSSLWLLMALHTTGGKLTTFEIDPEKIKLAANNFKKAGVDHLVTIVEGDAHEEVKKIKGPIDLLFIDADKAGYLDYLNKLLPLVRPGGLIVSHNMDSMNQDYINTLTTNPDLETLIPNQYMDVVGITLKKR
ncbi:MAG: class I SAM-dependent methyltransferase [Deltaproteobacteria bacterium]|nr:class I SAM-dependent methyltransferase [Deltaproteobacteria bacterium]